MTSAAPGGAGWYTDPAGRFDDRYFDGSKWTSAVKRGEQVESDPEAVPDRFAAGEDSGSPTIPPPPSASQAQSGQAVAPPGWPLGATGDRRTSLPLAEAQREVVRCLSLTGIVVKDQQPGLVQAAVPLKGETNVAIAVILCVLCIIPGVIYLITSSRTRMLPAAVALATASPGTTVITVQAAPAPRQAVLSALGTLP
jgi:hypothetical protein